MAEQEDKQLARLTDALFAGQKIEAIKIYRERTGCGLKEAKVEIEALEANLREQHPEKFPAQRKAGGGCAGAILAMMVTVTVIVAACTAAAAGLGI